MCLKHLPLSCKPARVGRIDCKIFTGTLTCGLPGLIQPLIVLVCADFYLVFLQISQWLFYFESDYLVRAKLSTIGTGLRWVDSSKSS